MPLQMYIPPDKVTRLYNPDRDLAYCTPPLIARAIRGLDPDRQEPWVKYFLDSEHITPDDLVEGARVMAEYTSNTLCDPQYKQPFEALEAAGFFRLPEAVQHIICAKLGQVFLSAFFVSIRDVTRDPKNPPMDKADMDAAARELQERVRVFHESAA